MPLQVDDEVQLHIIKSLLELCDVVERLVMAESQDEDDDRCDFLREQLNQFYNQFVVDYGYLSNCKSYYSGFFHDLRLSTYVSQLEQVEKYKVDGKKQTRIIKAEIFSKRINFPLKQVCGQIFFGEDLDLRISQAFSWCMGYYGTVNLEQVAEKAGVSKEAAESSLLEQGLIYREWIGLQSSSWWELLEVAPDCTLEELKAAYRKKSLQYHPDLNRSSGATLMMQLINAAYEEGKREKIEA